MASIMDMIQPEKRWRTTDGERHDTEELAVRHQYLLVLREQVAAWTQLMKVGDKRRKDVENMVMLWHEYDLAVKSGEEAMFLAKHKDEFNFVLPYPPAVVPSSNDTETGNDVQQPPPQIAKVGGDLLREDEQPLETGGTGLLHGGVDWESDVDRAQVGEGTVEEGFTLGKVVQ